jgi:hydrogenase maturation protease
MNSTGDSQRPLILGVGNLLMGDEGVGVAAIRHLEEKGFAEHAELVDGGTSGFHLLGLFRNQQRLILIDAATDGKPLGTVSLIRPRYANDFPPTLTAHDIGLKDLIESAALLGYWPQVDLITVSIGNLGLMTMELSPEVAAALPRIESLVKSCLEIMPADIECAKQAATHPHEKLHAQPATAATRDCLPFS